MAKGYKDLLSEADSAVTSFGADEVAASLTAGGVVLVDVRDVRELERDGMIENAIHAPRGMLEFWIDRESPYHKEIFAQNKTFIFYCASGWRSLLAAQTAQAMGLKSASMRGGFGAWKASGGAIVSRTPLRSGSKRPPSDDEK